MSDTRKDNSKFVKEMKEGQRPRPKSPPPEPPPVQKVNQKPGKNE